MRFTKNYILLSLITLGSCIKATVVSFNLWNNEDKEIAIIGERHVDIAVPSDEWSIRDKEHKTIFDNHLITWSRSDKKIAFLIESSPNFITKTQADINEYQKYAHIIGPMYIGMHASLPLLALKKQHYYSNITFIDFDLRPKPVMASIQFLINLTAFIYQATKYDIINEQLGSDDLPDYVKESAVEMLTNDFKKRYLIKDYENIKIVDYFESLKQIIEMVKKQDSDFYDILIQLVDQAKDLFKDNSCNDNDLIIEVFSNMILQHSLSNFIEVFIKIFQPISDLIAHFGAQIKLKEALANYDFIIVFGGDSHATYLNDHLKDLNFSNDLSIARDCFSDAPFNEKSLSNDELNEYLQNFTEKISVNGLKNICNSCNKIESIKGEYKRCGKCKKTHYCSTECQRKDWKEHKLDCKS